MSRGEDPPVEASARAYGLITACYWAFTLTDGALRMLVLLYLHGEGRSPLEIAGLFAVYELFGVFTNLGAGAVAARFGLRSTLLAGLGLQVAALAALGWQHAHLSFWLVMLLQAASGVAKDLTKMSSKSYTKFLVAAGDRQGLMRLVSGLTGSKNTLKGLGFFLGGWLLSRFGFMEACYGMGAGLFLAWIAAWFLPRSVGRAKSVGKLSGWLLEDRRVLWLSASRLALFASRDVWFVLALPLYLSTQLGLSHGRVGAFLALWVIGYGAVQAAAPKWIGGLAKGGRTAGWWLLLWTLALGIPLGWLVWGGPMGAPELFGGLILFAGVFATCSSLHSYLIIQFAAGEKVAQQVGAYYAANAAGRLLGTVLSGILYQRANSPAEGLQHALVGALALAGLAAMLCVPLGLAERRAENNEPRGG